MLQQLREYGTAQWHPFDWDAADWDSDRLPLVDSPSRVERGSVVVLEGAYSCRPELHDLLDLLVLLDVPREIRNARLRVRDGADYHPDWDARWSGAEDHYFGTVMTPDRFDVVLRAG